MHNKTTRGALLQRQCAEERTRRRRRRRDRPRANDHLEALGHGRGGREVGIAPLRRRDHAETSVNVGHGSSGDRADRRCTGREAHRQAGAGGRAQCDRRVDIKLVRERPEGDGLRRGEHRETDRGGRCRQADIVGCGYCEIAAVHGGGVGNGTGTGDRLAGSRAAGENEARRVGGAAATAGNPGTNSIRAAELHGDRRSIIDVVRSSAQSEPSDRWGRPVDLERVRTGRSRRITR